MTVNPQVNNYHTVFVGRSTRERHRDYTSSSKSIQTKVLMFVFATQLTLAAASHRLTLSGVTNSNTLWGCCRHQTSCDSCDSSIRALSGFHRCTQAFLQWSDVTWILFLCLLRSAMILTTLLRPARDCQRVIVSNIARLTQERYRTLAEYRNETTLHLYWNSGSRDNNSGFLSFVLIFSFLFPAIIVQKESERRFAALSYFNFLPKSRGSSQFCRFPPFFPRA